MQRKREKRNHFPRRCRCPRRTRLSTCREMRAESPRFRQVRPFPQLPVCKEQGGNVIRARKVRVARQSQGTFQPRSSPRLPLIHCDAQGKSRGTSALRVRTPGYVRQDCGAAELRSLGKLGRIIVESDSARLDGPLFSGRLIRTPPSAVFLVATHR